MLTTFLTLAFTQTGSIQTEYIKKDTPTMIVSHFEKEKEKHTNIFQPKQEEVKREQSQENTTEQIQQSFSQTETISEPTSQPEPTTYTFSNKNYSYTLDTIKRTLSQTDAGSKTTTYTYNSTGNVATKTDANGTVTTYSYDGLNRLTGKSINRAAGVEGVTSESYTYDALGRLVSSTDSDNHTITFAYNSLSQLTSETNNGETISYEYDSFGNLTKTTYPSGKQISRTYDALNRLTQIQNGTGTLNTYTYDPFGNLTTETLGNARVTSYTYDVLNRLATNKTETLSYDNNSNIVSNGLENYTYDNLNQLTQVTSVATPTVTQDFAYDLMGNRTQTTTGSGTVDYTKNALNEYTETQATSSGSTSTGSYTYDDNGNLTEDSTNKYIYDYKNRLTTVKRKSYDIVTTEEVTSTGITCPETGTGSESGTGSTGTGSTGTGSTGTGSTGTGSTSTGCTETTTTNTTTTTVTIPEYTLATYKYDTLGRRYEKKVYEYNQTTETTDLTKDISYTYSHQDAIQETDAVASTTKEYVYANEIDDLVASIQNGTTTYYEKNHLGSIVHVSDASGTILTEYQYDVYGTAVITSGSDTGNVRLFTGREFDSETSLYYNRARYYSPTLGRFISRDPIDIQDDVNLYSYTANNPVNSVDRMGKEGKPVVAKTYIPFVSEVVDIVTTSKILHYRRNNNLIKIESIQLAQQMGYKEQLPEYNVYHTFGTGNEGNIKYLSPDGHQEVIFDKNGKNVSTPENGATYNFGVSGWDHAEYDILPYYIWGNSESDSTSGVERILKTSKSILIKLERTIDDF